MWHVDYAFFLDPRSFTMITPRVLPSGRRETHYVDMERMARELPAALRERRAGRRCFHEATYYYKVQPSDVDKAIAEIIEEFRAEAPSSWHPAFVRHPVTGAEILYVSSGFTTAVESLSHEEARATLDEVFAFVEQPDHVHAVPHVAGSILVWDNRALVHMASSDPTDEPNMSYRISLDDGLPFSTDG
jgi:taurine dioxygenase